MRLEYLLEVLVKVTRNSMLRGARLSLGEIDRHVNNGTQIDWILDRSHVVYTSQQQALAKWSLVLQIRIYKDDDRQRRASTRRTSGAHCSPHRDHCLTGSALWRREQITREARVLRH